MRRLLIALAFVPAFAPAQGTGPYHGPIIDVHLHAETTERLTPSAPNPATGQLSPATADEHMARSLAIMKERNVVLGIVSGPTVADVERWDTAAPDRILKGISMDDPSTFMKPEELDRLFREKRLDAFGEVAAHDIRDPVRPPGAGVQERRDHHPPVHVDLRDAVATKSVPPSRAGQSRHTRD